MDDLTARVIETFSAVFYRTLWAEDAMLLQAMGVAFGSWVLSLLLSRCLGWVLERLAPGTPPATRTLLARVARYGVLFVGALAAMTILGVDLSAAVTASAVLFVGVGLALQKLIQSVVAGTLLLAGRELEPGDVVIYHGEACRVLHIGLRATVLETRFRESIVVPNFLLANEPLHNLTHRDPKVICRAHVGVAYGTDLERAAAVMEGAIRRVPGRTEASEPLVLVERFDPSCVTFLVGVTLDEPWCEPRARSAMLLEISAALERAGIEIPLPQMDVRLKEQDGTTRTSPGAT